MNSWHDTKNLIKLTLLYIGVIKLVTIKSPSLQLILAQMPFCEEIHLIVIVCVLKLMRNSDYFVPSFFWKIWMSLQIGMSWKITVFVWPKYLLKNLTRYEASVQFQYQLSFQKSDLYATFRVPIFWRYYSNSFSKRLGKEWERMTVRIVSPLLPAEKKTEFLLIGPWAHCCRTIS